MEREDQIRAIRALLDWAFYAFWTPVVKGLEFLLDRIERGWEWAAVVEEPRA